MGHGSPAALVWVWHAVCGHVLSWPSACLLGLGPGPLGNRPGELWVGLGRGKARSQCAASWAGRCCSTAGRLGQEGAKPPAALGVSLRWGAGGGALEPGS